MRFMIIVKATPESEAGAMPEEALLAAMAEYHEQLVKAGVLLDANGLQPTSKGWRVAFDAQGGRRVIDGPFTESKELVAGYTLIQVRTREEALEWSRRFPTPFPGRECHIELRQLFEVEDFGAGQAVERFKAIDALTASQAA
ncbi:MAG TPA: YciI family protein [Rhizobacter sp.]